MLQSPEACFVLNSEIESIIKDKQYRIEQLKKIGKKATIIGIFQAVVTTIIVDIFLISLHFIMPDKFSLSAAIVLGAIATATAPAATLMVVKQYKAKGPVTDILLPVVAIDDAVGLVIFAISFGIAKAISLGNAEILNIIFEPLGNTILVKPVPPKAEFPI